MVRHSIALVACALVLAGCGDRTPRQPQPVVVSAPAPPEATVEADTTAPTNGVTSVVTQQFSYTHNWTLRMPHGAVSPRFTRARDLCLQDKAIGCRLVTANISQGDGTPDSMTSASLEVQLPHTALAPFEHALLAPVRGEKPGDAIMVSRQTQAQSVETQAADTGRKVAQLTDYRDRLAALEKRPNLSVDDLIKLEGEESRVQSELDAASGLQRTLNDGIAREDVTIQLNETPVVVEAAGPIAQAWRDAGDTLAENTASALRFAIGAIPWLPVLALAIFLIARAWRLFRRRQKAIVAPG
ncbi:MAG TPA: DUF4349 domain-containing protein [Rhizomicrobium sp.]|nr:DUF4349 domain-containing protein [Rhizomicrobium sp.]